MPTKAQGAREQLGRLIGETYRLWRLRMDERLQPLGLSQARWHTLRELSRSGDGIPQRELAARVGIEAPTLVGILDGLERSGYVSRRILRSDRRVRTVHLTARAQRKLVQIEQVASELRREVTAGVEVARLASAVLALQGVRDRLLSLSESRVSGAAAVRASASDRGAGARSRASRPPAAVAYR